MRAILYRSQFEQNTDKIFEFIRDGKLIVTVDWNRSPSDVNKPQDKFIYVLSGDDIDEIMSLLEL